MTPEQESRLVVAMSTTAQAANMPLVAGLAAVNAHLKELNGKVASHAVLHEGSRVLLGTYGERLAGLERRSGEERREDPPNGENRTISKWDVLVALGGITTGGGLVLWLLKLIGKI